MLAAAKKALDRRSFLRAAPAAAVSAPVALRQVAAQATSGGMAAASGMYAGHPIANSAADPWALAHKEIMRLVRSGKIPEWKVKQLRRTAKIRGRWLDADLTAMRSISDSSRYRIQEDREVERQIKEAIDEEDNRSFWDSMMAKFSPFSKG